MRSLRLFALDEFKNNGRAVGAAPATLLKIARQIADMPFNSYHLAPLYQEIGRHPMSGFYVRSFMFDGFGERTNGLVLYLYLSVDFPVYLWDFYAGEYRSNPWSGEDEQNKLIGYGQQIHKALLGVL